MMEQKLFCLFVFDFFVGIYVYVRFYSVLIDVSFFTYKHAYQRPLPYEKMSFFFRKKERPVQSSPSQLEKTSSRRASLNLAQRQGWCRLVSYTEIGIAKISTETTPRFTVEKQRNWCSPKKNPLCKKVALKKMVGIHCTLR